MTEFTLYTPQTAPEKSKETLENVTQKYGITPNIFAHMAESPLPIEIYNFAQDKLTNEGTLSAEETNLVQLAISVFNECEFCVPAHSTAARKQFKTDDAIIDAIRDGQTVADPRINALVTLTQKLAEKRGQLNDEDTSSFLDAGFTKEQIFEIISIVAYKTITNYTSNVAGTKPNDVFADEAWTPLSKRQNKAA